ncbi:MAG: glycosyltransferase family A protein, partial [Xanthobacteraceae bacterium]
MPILPTANPPLFTIFTPTYNRAHTIRRVFDSLCAQTLRDFEWLVIDDGSTDNTSELIALWEKTADFPVRYLKQKHAGKHIAHNRALVEAKGQFFGIVDSDDALVPDALERLARLWNSIPEGERHLFCSVGARCRSQTGKIIGHRFPSDPFDA